MINSLPERNDDKNDEFRRVIYTVGANRRTQSLEIDKPKPIALIRKTPSEVINKIDELLASCTDQEIARQLNELGLKNWRGEPFTSKKVLVIRNAYHLKSRFERLRERGLLTAHEMATQLAVCPATIYSWAHDGFLREHRYGNKLSGINITGVPPKNSKA